MPLRVYPNEPKATSTQKPACRCFCARHGNSSHNCQELEATQVPCRWVDKWTVVHPHNGVLPNTKKKKELSNHGKTWGKFKRLRSQSEGSTLRDSNHGALWKRHPAETGRRSAAGGGVRKGGRGRAPRIFRQWNHSVWHHDAGFGYCRLVKVRKTHNTQTEP